MGNQNSRVHHLSGVGGDVVVESAKEKHAFRGKYCFNVTENKRRNPFRDYEVVHILGVGSAGEVSKVRRRPCSMAESSRRRKLHTATAQRGTHSVALLGGVFQSCARNLASSAGHNVMITSLSSGQFSSDRSTITSRTAASSSRWTSSFRWRENGRSSSLTGEISLARQSEQEHEVFYALKSTTYFKVGASKSLAANEYFTRELKNEIRILQRLDHPNIVKPVEVFAHRNKLFVVMELCTGGDLHSRDPYTEMEAVEIARSVLSALAYMHSKHVSHRDIKYENIMFANNSPTSPVKLIDFGLSTDFSDNDYMKTGVGTIIMMAPQVFEGKYTPKADLWSVGVLVYMLLSGQLAFFGKTRRHVIDKIMRGTYKFEGKRWNGVSSKAKSFVSTLLRVDESLRPSARDALRHPWIEDYSERMTSICDAELPAVVKIAESMESFSRCTLLKKMAMNIIAQRSTNDDIRRLIDVFRCFDSNVSGVVTEENIHACLSRLGYSSERVHHIFRGIDFFGQGCVNYSQFLASTLETNGPISETRLAEAFDVLDYGRDGIISSADLRAVLSKHIPEWDIDGRLHQFLADDQGVCYDQYLELWRPPSSTSADTEGWESR